MRICPRFAALAVLAILPVTSALARPLEEGDVRKAKKIAILFGVLDPVTEGHLQTAEAAVREGGADLTILLPTPESIRKDPVPISQRLKMIDAAATSSDKILYPAQGPLYDLLVEQKDVRAWIKKLRELAPEATIYSILGEDAATNGAAAAYNELMLRPDALYIAPRTPGVTQKNEIKLSAPTRLKPVTVLTTAPRGMSSTKVRTYLSEHPELYFDPEARIRHPIPGLNRAETDYILDHGLFLGKAVNNHKKLTQIIKETAIRATEALGIKPLVRQIILSAQNSKVPEQITLNGKKYTVRKLLGEGLEGSVYLVETGGKRYALKIPSFKRPRSQELVRNALVQRWVGSKTGIRVPEMIDIDPKGAWVLSEFREGPTLFQILKDNRPLPDSLQQELGKLIEEGKRLKETSSISLDLRSDNIIVSDGKPYLVDLGGVPSGVRQPSTLEEALAKWSDEVHPRLSVPVSRTAGRCLRTHLLSLLAKIR